MCHRLREYALSLARLRAAQEGLLPLLIALSPEVQAKGVPVEVVAALLDAYPKAINEVMNADQRALLNQAMPLAPAAAKYQSYLNIRSTRGAMLARQWYGRRLREEREEREERRARAEGVQRA